MNFKKWLSEWEGFRFPGNDSQFYNGPSYPRSKYRGPGNVQDDPGWEPDRFGKMFGFKNRKKKKKKVDK